jgi:lysophospholipase L1-like esterase
MTGGASTAGEGGAGGGALDGGAPPAGGTGGAGEFTPCPTNGDPCKILPLGDSITHGYASTDDGGYRTPLFAAIVAARQNVTFTGSLRNGPEQVSGASFPRSHEGHDGWGISTVTPYSNGNAGIATVIPSPAFDSANGGVPDIILLHIGTNDTGSSTAPEMAERLDGLIAKLTAAAPDALLVVAQIVNPGSWSAALTDDFNALLPEIVDAHAAAGEHVVLVDMNVGFDPSTMMASDDIHPNDAGYARMAERWYSVIGALLPQ